MFAFVQVLLMWFCFSTFWGDRFDRIWFPVIYVGLVLVVLFNPFKFGYFHTRKWLLYTLVSLPSAEHFRNLRRWHETPVSPLLGRLLSSRIPWLLVRRYLLQLNIHDGKHPSLLLSLVRQLGYTRAMQLFQLQTTRILHRTPVDMASSTVFSSLPWYPQCIPTFSQRCEVRVRYIVLYDVEHVANR